MSSATLTNNQPTTVIQQKLVGVFLVVGLLMRCSRYLMNFPLWEDECFLAVNFIDRGYLELLEPLRYHQVAPVLFLWIELTTVKLFGFHEFALRAFPFLCSIVGLFLFLHLAKRLLSGSALVLAVGIFAVSYPNMRYAAEAKQYASDMLAGLIYLTMCVEWWRAFSSTDTAKTHCASRWLWALVVFTPVAVGLSYSAVFSAGAVSLFVLMTIISRVSTNRDPAVSLLSSLFSHRQLRLWTVYNIALLGSFAVVLLIAAQGQASAELDWMGRYWSNAFPPLGTPAELPLWLLETHCGPLLAFPLGGHNFASAFTTICVLIGVIALARRNRILAVLLLMPATLHLIAAALQRYPYGGHFKFSMHMAGVICLLAGFGAVLLLDAIGKLTRTQRYTLAVATAYLLLVGSGTVIRDIRSPYKTESDMRARAFAQWFWFSTSFQGESLCVENDLGIILTPKAQTELSWTAMYWANKAIYSSQTVNHLDDLKVTHKRPLRCVIYRDPKFKFDQSAFEDWMSEMTSRWELVSTEKYPFPLFAKYQSHADRDDARAVDYAEIYKFVPKSAKNEVEFSEDDESPAKRR
jgi:hypothetical protein